MLRAESNMAALQGKLSANHLGAIRPGRVIGDRLNTLETLSETQVFCRYRFRPVTIIFIVNLVTLQVLVCLRVYATGTFQSCVGDTLNISQATVSRCVRRVGKGLASLRNQFIRFPTGERALEVKTFASIAGKLSKVLINHVLFNS